MENNVGYNILNYIQDRLLVKHPFLGMLVANVPIRLMDEAKIKNYPINWIGLLDGQIIVDEASLIRLFYNNEDAVYYAYLHSLLHFLYCHDILAGTYEDNISNKFKVADKEVNEVLIELESDGDEVITEVLMMVADDHSFWIKDDKIIRDSSDEYVNKEEISRRKELSRKVLTNLETFSKNQAGDSMILNLRKAVRDKKDYKTMLSLFATPEEILKVSMDEFDYGMYSYGLSINPDMPMVEMVEVSDDNKIRDFVIAIDTSGSTSGQVVQSFLDKTYSVLCTEGAFASKTNIYLIQCDSSIQKETVIHTNEEMHKAISTLTILGSGSTDFRPVFKRVDELIKTGALTRLKGLIYFTDGRGTYPTYAPAYKTAFVLTEEMYDSAIIPGWAMKIMI